MSAAGSENREVTETQREPYASWQNEFLAQTCGGLLSVISSVIHLWKTNMTGEAHVVLQLEILVILSMRCLLYCL